MSTLLPRGAGSSDCAHVGVWRGTCAIRRLNFYENGVLRGTFDLLKLQPDADA